MSDQQQEVVEVEDEQQQVEDEQEQQKEQSKIASAAEIRVEYGSGSGDDIRGDRTGSAASASANAFDASSSSSTTNSNSGIITGYKCDFHVMESQTITENNGHVKDSYYDMKYPCELNPDDGMVHNGFAVLSEIANQFKISPDSGGYGCVIPDTSLPLWMIGASSEPSDSIVENLPCQKLTIADDEKDSMCCVVVHAPMTFWWTDGQFRDSDILDVLRDKWNDVGSHADATGKQFEIEYLGAVMELPGQTGYIDGTDLDISPPVINAVKEGQPKGQGTVEPANNNKFTIVGGFVLAGLLAVFIGAVFVLMRRRNKSRQADIEVAVQKSGSSNLDGYGSDGPTLEVDVLSDDCMHQHSHNQDYPTPVAGVGGAAGRNSCSFDQERQEHPEDVPAPSSYTFDLANSLKNDVMGTYGVSSANNSSSNGATGGSNAYYDENGELQLGNIVYGGAPTSMAVVPPYPMLDETSDSEVDSWAQTDGTVGSLEDRLEEITAEI